MAATLLIAVVIVYVIPQWRGSGGTSIPAADQPLDSVQGKPNEVTVEKDGIVVTLRTDKREYEQGGN